MWTLVLVTHSCWNPYLSHHSQEPWGNTRDSGGSIKKKKKAENATQGMSCVWLYFFDHMINRNLVPRPRSRGQSGQRRRRNGTWLLSDLSRAIWLHVRQDLSGAALGAALTNSMFSNFP